MKSYRGTGARGLAVNRERNIAAPKAYHSQFPPDEIVPDKNVWFQNGKQIDYSDFSDGKGQAWREVCKNCHIFHSLLLQLITQALRVDWDNYLISMIWQAPYKGVG